MKKFLFCTLLCLTTALAPISVFAAENTAEITYTVPSVPASEGEIQDRAGVIAPFYKELMEISSGLTISDSGRATCGSTALINPYSSVHIEMRVTLWQKVGSSWQEVDSWTKTGSVGQSLLFSKYYNGLDSGYDYKVKSTIKVYQGSKLIEGDILDSPIVYY